MTQDAAAARSMTEADVRIDEPNVKLVAPPSTPVKTSLVTIRYMKRYPLQGRNSPQNKSTITTPLYSLRGVKMHCSSAPNGGNKESGSGTLWRPHFYDVFDIFVKSLCC